MRNRWAAMLSMLGLAGPVVRIQAQGEKGSTNPSKPTTSEQLRVTKSDAAAPKGSNSKLYVKQQTLRQQDQGGKINSTQTTPPTNQAPQASTKSVANDQITKGSANNQINKQNAKVIKGNSHNQITKNDAQITKGGTHDQLTKNDAHVIKGRAHNQITKGHAQVTKENQQVTKGTQQLTKGNAAQTTAATPK